MISITEKVAKKILSKCDIMKSIIREDRIDWCFNDKDKVYLRGKFTIDELRSLIFLIANRLDSHE